MCVGTLTNRSQPFYKELQKCHFVYMCIFILRLFWTQEFNWKHFKVFYSLSLCIDWTLQHLFISISPSVCTAAHQCMQSRHASNDFSYPYLFPCILLLTLNRYSINIALWWEISTCIEVHKQNHLKVINTNGETQEFTSEYIFCLLG